MLFADACVGDGGSPLVKFWFFKTFYLPLNVFKKMTEKNPRRYWLKNLRCIVEFNVKKIVSKFSDL